MPKQPSAQLHNLPLQATPFIGRETEIARIRALLVDPACRLLTLVGPGGVGKTRLAIQAVAGLTGEFAQGLYFTPLQGVDAAEFMISALAEAVHFSLSGQQEPLAQVLNYLSDKTMLLLLDNFEQLADRGGPAILLEILAAAPGIKLLVTSREVLNLQQEWLVPLQGLPIPETVRPDDPEPAGAVQLFAARARQVSPDFSAADRLDAVLQICQLVEGMPLAVELAASWTRTLSCQAIAAEIQRSLDFLTTPLRNVPERHRSMAAVFDASWQLLGQAEQGVFKRLSVFRGGFRREAAERVAGAALANLAALVDKSMLRREANDRYQIHELLRQYAQDRLEAQGEEVSQAQQAHCAYYAEFLYRRRVAIESGDQKGAVTEIEAELENVRAAWQWAIAHTRVSEIQKLSQAFTVFCHYQSRYLEAANVFSQVRACLTAAAPTRQTQVALADVLVRLGWFHIRLGQFETAQAELAESRDLLARLGAAPPPHSGADPLPALAILATISGDYDEAVRLGQAARQGAEARADRQNLAFAHYVLTGATLARGDYEAAREHARRACETATGAGNRWFLAYCLNEWGNVARAVGDYAGAKRHFQESYRIREAFDDPEGMAVALNHLGEMAIRQADFPEAQRRYRQSFAIYNAINDRGGLAVALDGLGQTACAQAAYSSAAQYFQQALAIAAEIRFLPLICAMLLSISELLFKLERPERGLELLAFVWRHPASDQETRDRAGRALEHYRPTVSPKRFTASIDRGQQHDLDTLAAALQSELAQIPDWAVRQDRAAPAAPPAAASQTLVDPLTERELEVLRLMAAGRSNREICDELVLAMGSVKWYASQIYSKLQVKNRTEAAARARQLKLLP